MEVCTKKQHDWLLELLVVLPIGSGLLISKAAYNKFVLDLSVFQLLIFDYQHCIPIYFMIV